MNTDLFIISEKQKELDQKMVLSDLWATKVHVVMLAKQKIIQKNVAVKIIKALEEIEKEYEGGKFNIDNTLGLHLTIEKKVVEKIGEDGYYMHTARSRNDQVTTCELLYLKEKILHVFSLLIKLQKVVLVQVQKNIDTVMPGYTHMQPAKPTTVGQWLLSYFDMFAKCINSLEYVYQKYNFSPLGAVESYGTSWNIDRAYTAKLLGFLDVWELPLEAISSRGFVQLAVLDCLKNISIIISKITSDLLLFNTFEFSYITFPDSLAKQMGGATGSSIMPQKKNPDVLELLRSVSPQIIGFESIVANILANLPMGYNRDTREIKEYMELGFLKTENAIISLTSVIESMEINKEKMKKGVLENYSLSADLADYIAQKTGMPYRKVYKVVGDLVKEKIKEQIPITKINSKDIIECAKNYGLHIPVIDEELVGIFDPEISIKKRKHIGGTAKQVMKKMISKRKNLINKFSYWINSESKRNSDAKIKTEEEILKMLKPVQEVQGKQVQHDSN